MDLDQFDQPEVLPAEHLPLVKDPLDVLEQILEALKTSTTSLGVSDKATAPELSVDFPFPGSKHFLIPRVATGGIVAVEAEPKASIVCRHNHSRVGGTITNSGATAVRLFLTGAGEAEAQGAMGVIFLAAEGGSWDFRLAGMAWQGRVAAKGIGGAGQLDVVEV